MLFIPRVVLSLALYSGAISQTNPLPSTDRLEECGVMQGYKDDIPFWPDNHIHGVGTPTGGDWEWEKETLWKMDGNTNWHYSLEEGRASSHHTSEERCGGIS
ncbi:MAG: hypothetical protein IT353_05075 [Gemmatimonadaceae bacterium]|nr:hypothetical protein [Gemmatimonadaceae bacterium]